MPRFDVTVVEESFSTERTPEEVFAFFDRPENIARVTPRTLSVSLEAHPSDLRLGTIFAYRLKKWPVDLVWDVVVSEYAPPERFRNVKARGYFPKWAHTHQIVPRGEGSEVRISLEYEVPDGIKASLSHSYVIRDAMRELVKEQSRAFEAALERGE